jgi:hypothetical protein
MGATGVSNRLGPNLYLNSIVIHYAPLQEFHWIIAHLLDKISCFIYRLFDITENLVGYRESIVRMGGD